MIDEFNQAIEDYRGKWEKLVAGRANKAYFDKLKPTSIGWKTEDLGEFDKRFAELRELSDQIHQAWLNERWLTIFHFRDTKLAWGIEMVILMQRRPGSRDAVGLDHIDFYTTEKLDEVEAIAKAEPDLKVTRERNNPNCEWISLWFDNTEAKLRPYTKLDVAIAELKEVNDKLVASLSSR